MKNYQAFTLGPMNLVLIFLIKRDNSYWINKLERYFLLSAVPDVEFYSNIIITNHERSDEPNN